MSPSARYVEFPTARHGVGWWPDGERCGFEVMAQFLTDPAQPFDLSCIDAAPPFTFEPDPEWLLETFETDDLWGDQEP